MERPMPLLRRKAYDELVRWKRESQGSTAILIEGARRVGKSTLARKFGEREYRSCLVIDFYKASDDVKALFDDLAGDLDALFSYLSGIYGVTLHERESLIVLDEIQFFPRARGLVKYFVEDGRYDFVETGSLVSIKMNTRDILIPSEEEALELPPLDFEEFLWAMGEEQLAGLVRDAYERRRPLPDALHKKASRLLREYMLVGGMPKPLAAYTESRSLAEAEKEKTRILRLYRNDVARFAQGYEYKVTSVFDEMPAQLSKHEKRFTLSTLAGDPRMRSYEESFFWLADARIANVCYNTTDPNVGLGMNEDRPTLKCYMADTGLLVTHAFSDQPERMEEARRDILLGKVSINEGMLAENLVAQALRASGRKLWFYSAAGDAGRGRMEIDFLITAPYENAGMKSRVSPIEVKSTKRYTTSSLDRFKEKFGRRVGTQYVLHPGQLSVEEGGERLHLPLYMAWLL